MTLKHQLQQAVEHKLLLPEQLDPLLLFLTSDNTKIISTTQEEPLKFIRSFGDVFITFGVLLLAYAMTLLEFSSLQNWIPVLVFLIIAEWLVRIRHLALPGMAILISILFFVQRAIEFNHEHATLLGLSVLSFTSLAFYLRYKMPFSIFPLAIGLVAIAVLQIGLDVLKQPLILSAIGFILFIIAMWFDSRDTRRVSHLSDTAFWLHLLASPLMVHGVMTSLIFNSQPVPGNIPLEVFIMIFFVMIFLLALLLDRRAMVISTQIYAIYAFTQLLGQQLSSDQNVFIIVIFAVALFIIFFGTFWYKTRSLIFGFLVGSKISSYIPDLNTPDLNGPDLNHHVKK